MQKNNTKKNMKHSTHKLALSLTASILAAGGAQAYDLSVGTNLPPVEVHGFFSQGFLDSSKYNYLVDSSRGSFLFTEMGVNLSFNPFPRTRIAIQAFDFDVGNVNNYDPFLDYALVEYTLNDEIGIRAGRIRRPGGIYNSIQDIDLARTFVLLPQGIYDARWRDWSASLDGGELFGNISLGKAGGLSYEGYAGVVNMNDNGGLGREIQPDFAGGTFNGINSTPTFGTQLWYNTPVDGLRFGASFAYMQNWGFGGTFPPSVYVPFAYGAQTVGNVVMQQYSAEYLWRNWTFQTEFYTYDWTGHTYVPAFNSVTPAGDNPQCWYVAASYRFNKYVETGAYYTQFRDFSTASSSPAGHQNDAALSLRLDLKSWWVFKIEGHMIEGTALLRDPADNPAQDQNGKPWYMLAVKTTFSF